MPEEFYEFTDQTYANIAANGVSPQSVLAVLYGTNRIRRHIGSALHVAGRDHNGDWVAVALIERDDDHYTVTNARYLDAAEVNAVRGMRRQG